jgi:4-hydroxy-tetrahydrodipicolinate synthase
VSIKRFDSGLWVALLTPMRGGSVDHDALKALVESHLEAGTRGLVPCGTTGESATLSEDEQAQVIEVVVKTADSKLQVMAGTGANSTQSTIQRTRKARELGADGALIVTPYYNKPTQGGLRAHYLAVAEAVAEFPICLYNVPSRTAVDLLPATAAALASCPSIVAIKEASGQVERVTELRAAAPDLDVFSGDDGLTLPMLALGAVGVISVLGNIVPGEMAAMLEAFESGELGRARKLHDRLHPLMKAMFTETNPIPVKAAAELLGLCSSELRLPLVAASAETRASLKSKLQGIGLSA